MNRRRFLKQAGLWAPAALAFPTIVRAQRSAFSDPGKLAATMRRLQVAGFAYYATAFDGSTNYMHRDSIDNNPSSKVGIFSTWIKVTDNDSGFQYLIQTQYGNLRIQRGSGGYIGVQAQNASDTQVLYVTSTETPMAVGAGWVCIMVSWDLGNNLVKGYVGDTALTMNKITFTNDNVTLHYPPLTVAGDNVGGNLLTGYLCEMYLGFDTYLDFSVEANRRKFYSASAKPVDKGTDGHIPTGNVPYIYLPNPYSTFGENPGLEGNFTVVGTLAAAPDKP